VRRIILTGVALLIARLPVAAYGATRPADVRAASASLTIVAGNNQQGLLGQRLAQPLVVQLLEQILVSPAPPVSPVPGAAVQWRVTRGQAQLEPASDTTDEQGQASTNVMLGSVGAIEVEAVAAGVSVTFTLVSTTCFKDCAEGPVAVPIAQVLDGICARNDPTFSTVCKALSALSNSDLTPALEHVAPQESAVQSIAAREVISAVTTGIQARLAAVRTGVKRSPGANLSIDANGHAIPVGALAKALLPRAMSSAAGNAENDDNGWSAFLSGDLGSGKRIVHSGQLGFKLDSRGVMAGVDHSSGENIFGISLNLMKLDSKLNDDAGSIDVNCSALSIYGSRGGLFASGAPATGTGIHYDGVHIDGSLTAGKNRYASEHVVAIPGTPVERATSVNDATLFALTGATAVDAHRGSTEFEASVSGSWSRTRIGDLTENGSGPLILFVQGHEIDSLLATAGFTVHSGWSVPFGTLSPNVHAEMIHEFKSAARLVTARFRRDVLGTPFTIPIDRPDTNYGKIAAGFLAGFPGGVSAYIEATQDVLRSDLKYRTVQFGVLKSF